MQKKRDEKASIGKIKITSKGLGLIGLNLEPLDLTQGFEPNSDNNKQFLKHIVKPFTPQTQAESHFAPVSTQTSKFLFSGPNSPKFAQQPTQQLLEMRKKLRTERNSRHRMPISGQLGQTRSMIPQIRD